MTEFTSTGANCTTPGPPEVLVADEETHELLVPQLAFMRLAEEQWLKGIFERYGKESFTPQSVEIIHDAFWRGEEVGRARYLLYPPEHYVSMLNTEVVRRLAAELPEEFQALTVTLGRQAWFEGYRTAQRAKSINVTASRV